MKLKKKVKGITIKRVASDTFLEMDESLSNQFIYCGKANK